jgi:hypothetical protein
LVKIKQKELDENVLWQKALYAMMASSKNQFLENLKEAINHGILLVDRSQPDVNFIKTNITP